LVDCDRHLNQYSHIWFFADNTVFLGKFSNHLLLRNSGVSNSLEKTLADLKDKSGHAILGQFADLWTGIISKGAEFIFAPETHSLRRAKTGYYDDLTHADQ